MDISTIYYPQHRVTVTISNNEAASMVPFYQYVQCNSGMVFSVPPKQVDYILHCVSVEWGREREVAHTKWQSPEISRPWLFFRLRGKIFMYRNPAQKSYCSGPALPLHRNVFAPFSSERFGSVFIDRAVSCCREGGPSDSACLPSRSEEWNRPGIRASALGCLRRNRGC